MKHAWTYLAVAVCLAALALGRQPPAAAQQTAASPAAESPPAAQTSPPPVGRDWTFVVVMVLAGAMSLALAGMLVHFLVLVPRRRRRPLLEALAILQSDNKHRLPEAERLLGEALTAGLKPRDIAEARFALAFVRAELGHFPEAATVLADIDESHRDRETHYLDLWLQSKQKAHRKVEDLYTKYGAILDDLLDTRLIAGIAYLEQARADWSARRVAVAVENFKKLRALGVLQEEIPEQIDDHQVTLGIAALLEKNFDEAEKHFTGAVQASGDSQKSTIAGELGLLLCRWRRGDTASVEEILEDVLKRMEQQTPIGDDQALTRCSHCGQEFRARTTLSQRRVNCRSCRRGFFVEFDGAAESETPDETDGSETGDEAALNGADRKELLLGDDELLLRNALLWRAFAAVANWRALPPRQGLPPAEQERLNQYMARVIEVDPACGDAYLLRHLIGYYFAGDDAAREAAIRGLDEAAAHDVNVPELLDLIEREKKLAQFQQDSLRRFYTMVKDYATNPSVPEEYRRKLLERLGRFNRFREFGDVPVAHDDDEAAPSVADLQNRSTLLIKRVNDIMKRRAAQTGDEDPDVPQILNLARELEEHRQTLDETARLLQDREHELLASTGEEIFSDDDGADLPAPS